MRSGAGPRTGTPGFSVLFALLLACFLHVEPSGAQVQEEPPDTIPVDSTLLRIQQQLLGLAKPVGIDSTYFLPDSLLPDSLRELREARAGGPRPGVRVSAPAGGAGLTGGDSILAALKELEGYSLTEYQSLGADFGAQERRLILLGTPDAMAQIVADGLELTADSLFYDEEKGKVWSSGSEAIFKPQDGDPVNSRVIVFDLNEDRGTALDATTKYSGGGEWIVHGDLVSVTDTASFGTRLQFTSCELEEPHYHFASNNVKIVRGNLLVARPVKLYFADVPVAWLPFMVQNLSQGVSSGILTPTFSVNDIVRTSQSYSRRLSNLGFYWAGSDYYDATVFLDWWSGEHLALTGSGRFNWAKQFLTGNLSVRRFWREIGTKELALSGNTSWEASERTKLRFRGSYASSSSMVRETSFDPREVVQSIDSEGGLTHRFDFGNLTLAANRKQHLSDDRVDMTLPNLSFSLSPQTFFQASPAQARFYNNITWSGSSSFRRSSSDRPVQSDTLPSGEPAPFNPSLADKVRTDARFSTGLSLGNFSLGGGMDFSQNVVREVPHGVLPGEPLAGQLEREDPFFIQDSTETEAGWNASLGYQQRLIGSTTLTPSLSLSGRFKRSNMDPLATSFVSGPTRLSLGVSLRGDLYGFFGGFGDFEAIRHKISPGFDFSYAPKVSPTELQTQVFGSSEVRAQRVLRISLNQTWEARRKTDSTEVAPPGAGLGAAAIDSSLVAPGDSTVLPLDSLMADSLMADSLMADTLTGPLSPQDAQKVTLLALKTTAMTYDFEEAAEQGDWIWGITTTRITNTISSDYLRGLNLTMAHDLFEDVFEGGGEGAEATSTRKFSPHLSSLNFGFSLDGNSLPFKLLGSLLGGKDEEAGPDVVSGADPVEAEDPENPFAPSLTDESSIIPMGSDPAPRSRAGGGSGGSGGWRASLTFSMQRPRDETGQANQMLQGSLNFNLTENWDATWRTSYDMIAGSFNDHFIQLTRNLHRWEAHFDFRKTATGNWSFRFEVALTDQEDLHFDYSQRSYQDRSGGRRF